jgi:HAD superfamily hydrolase (TIGR01509 family)
MNIIIPLGGKGERFTKEGYHKPKALIDVFDKTMIETVIDNLNIKNDDNLFIIYNPYLDKNGFEFSTYIKTKYPKVYLIKLENDTKGAAESVYLGIEHIYKNTNTYLTSNVFLNKTILLDCDTFYTEDILTIFRNSNDNMVFYTKKYNEPPIYSYITLDEKTNTIINIAEKNKISVNANTGAYAFVSMALLNKYCEIVINEKIYFNNEPYTSCVISKMLDNNIKFVGTQLNNKYVFSLGTPIELKKYVENTYGFLFDLDGTLVITDDIYYNTWKELLENYNITLTEELFKKYIQGNNDKYVLNTLLSKIDIDLNELSNKKDSIFLQNIDKIVVIEGVLKFIEKISMLGHKICIVTNCNRIVAETIVKHIDIYKYIDYIVANGETEHAKPNPMPYLYAMTKCNIESSKCFIFEDSKSGLLSAKSSNPKCLIGIDTVYTKDELENVGVDICISNYLNIDIEYMFSYNNNEIENIKNYIKESLPFDVDDIIINNNKLKGGFIADVNQVKILKTNGEIINSVLKIENNHVSDLSKMAKSLDLYEREYYFYDRIACYVNVKIPKYISLVKNENYRNIGILLENLFLQGNYKVNLNLNNEKIEISLNIIEKMAKFHTKFWNKKLKSMFPELKMPTDPIFCPTWYNFIYERWELFKKKWENILHHHEIQYGENIINEFIQIQQRLSFGNVTIIHGDIKSPNIFYDIDKNYEPCFIDWQHIAIGKGVQDLVFFLIESFDIEKLPVLFPLFKNYYYIKLIENGISYSSIEYEKDLKDALHYVPFFTAVWFGTVPYDDLIDKNFPYFFIQKLFYMYELAK